MGGNDNPSLQIITTKLDGTNYLSWSCTPLLAIQSQGLYTFNRKSKGTKAW